MENELHPHEELHPEIAFQIGAEQQNQARLDVHPFLAPELEQQPEMVENQPQIEQQMVENQPSTEETAPDQSIEEPVQESPKDRDWRAVRQQADEARHLAREKEQLERELNFYRNQQKSTTTNDDSDDDSYVERRQLKEYDKRMRDLEEKTKRAEQQVAVARAEQRLLEDYPDIRNVVSNENIERLKDDYPNLYNSVTSSTDVYTVGSAAYEMIIAKGIYKKASNTLTKIASANSATKNISKPRSASSVAPQQGETPIQRANDFMGGAVSSDEERAQIYKDMVAASRSRY